MLKIYTDEETEKQYQNLPQILKDAMYDADIADKIFDIGKSGELVTEKIKVLAEETGYVTLGLTRPMEFVERLSTRLEINVDRAKTIAKEINHQIFFPLREALKTAHRVEISEDEIERGAAMMKKAPIAPMPPPSQKMPEPAAAEALADKPAMIRQAPPPPIPLPTTPKPPLPEIRPTPTPAPKPIEPLMPSSSKIVLEKKPELNLPPSKIPPIDLRNQKEPVPPPSPFSQKSTKNTAAAIAAPPPTTPPPAPKKNSYDKLDPYKEPVE